MFKRFQSPLTSDITILNGKKSGVAAAVCAAKYSERYSYTYGPAVLLLSSQFSVLAFMGIATIWFAVFHRRSGRAGRDPLRIVVMKFVPFAG
jgi:hypothetical protein